ncbi:hypothetical protein ACFSC4_16110 [Deinococcus malanensis]|uniref:hypothetical protein n=1 Tax=Deinococcus malanensis TaxID=1706855 RepID=UPI0016691618|nr:hypothetical protein [Deinococcus malanensis]
MTSMATSTAGPGRREACATAHAYDVLSDRARLVARDPAVVAAMRRQGTQLNDLLRVVLDLCPELDLLPLPLLAQELRSWMSWGPVGCRVRTPGDRPEGQPVRRTYIRRAGPNAFCVSWRLQ